MARFEFYDLPPEAKAGLVRLKAKVAGTHVLLAGLRVALLLRKANFNDALAVSHRGITLEGKLGTSVSELGMTRSSSTEC